MTAQKANQAHETVDEQAIFISVTRFTITLDCAPDQLLNVYSQLTMQQVAQLIKSREQVDLKSSSVSLQMRGCQCSEEFNEGQEKHQDQLTY